MFIGVHESYVHRFTDEHMSYNRRFIDEPEPMNIS
jgi:hypothetical protein